MTTSRDGFLNKIRSSLKNSLLPNAGPQHPGSFQDYSFDPNVPTMQLVERFRQELEALSGHVYIVSDIEDVAGKITGILEQHGAERMIAWQEPLPGLLDMLAQAGIAVSASELPELVDGRKASLQAMDDVKVGLTGAHAGLADTGAVALISGPGRGRLASLLPPVHIAVLPKEKLYASLPVFLADNPQATTEGSNLVLIAGPSRTGDIEMTLTMGVHGPGEVHVIII